MSPSAAVYLRTLEPAGAQPTDAVLLGVPDPGAPLIASEVQGVAATFRNPVVIEGPDATSDRLSRVASRARVLHMATHAHFRADNALYSSLRLADRPVTLSDLATLELNAELVTLSGCETGQNAVTGGDELFGLSRGLLTAGARSLLVSLWEVNDAATAEFMCLFYSGLRDGFSRADAVSAAARAVRTSRPHPFFWAAFTLIGDHRALQVPPLFWRTRRHPLSTTGV